MKEQGIVTEVKGDKAVVKVLTLSASGCGCGSFACRSFEELEVQNLCEAKKDDWVLFDSQRNIEKGRASFQTAGSFTVFCLGTGLAQIVFKTVAPALALGIAAGISAFAAFAIFFRRNPLKPASAERVIDPPESRFEKEGPCLI